MRLGAWNAAQARKWGQEVCTWPEVFPPPPQQAVCRARPYPTCRPSFPSGHHCWWRTSAAWSRCGRHSSTCGKWPLTPTHMQTCVVLTLRTCRFLVKCSNAHVVVWVPPPARDSQLTPVQALPDRLFELYGLTEGPHTVLDRSCVLSKVCWAAGLLLQEMNNPHGHESSKNSNHQRRYDTLALRCVGPNTIRVLKCLFGRFLVDVPNNPLPQSLQSETVDLDFMFNPVFMQYVLFLQLQQ